MYTNHNRRIGYRRIGSLLAAALLLLQLLAATAERVFAAEPALAEVSNGILKLAVDEKGRYTVKTAAGSPLRPKDDNQSLLYAGQKPETTYATFRIDGKNYVFGESYGPPTARTVSVQGRPEVSGQAILTRWNALGILVTQRLELVTDPANQNYGNVLIQYTVQNTTNHQVELGSRILLDTMAGSNDGAPIRAGDNFIDTETVLLKDNPVRDNGDRDEIPDIWHSTDNEFAPSTVAFGYTSGWGNTKPDKMIVGHWQGLYESEWDYTIDPNLNFTIESAKYGPKDTGIGLYWNPSALAPNQFKSFETYYGVGEIPDKPFTYSVQMSQLSKFTVNSTYDGYVEQTAVISVEVANNLSVSQEVYGLKAVLSFEDGISLADPTDSMTQGKMVLKAGEVQRFTWTIKATPQQMYKTVKYRVDVYDQRQIDENNHVKTDEIYSVSRYVLLPKVDGAPPELQYSLVTPDKLYYNDKRSFTIKGSGFEIYRNPDAWKLYLVNKRTHVQTLIPSGQIVVQDDTSMLVTVEGKMTTGEYELVIEQTENNQTTRKTLPFQMTMTSDKKYMSRNFGLLAVVKEFNAIESRRQVQYYNRLIPLQNESQLAELERELSEKPVPAWVNDQRQVLLTIKGDIREVLNPQGKVNKYLVYSSNKKAVINDIFTYTSSVPMVVSDNKTQLRNQNPGYDFGYAYDTIPDYDLGFDLAAAFDSGITMDTALDPDDDEEMGVPSGFNTNFAAPNLNFDTDYPSIAEGGLSGLFGGTFVYIQGAGVLGVNASNGFDFWIDSFSIALKDKQKYTLEGDRDKPDETIAVNLRGVGQLLNLALSGFPISIHQVIFSQQQGKDLLSFGAEVAFPFLGNLKLGKNEKMKGVSLDAKDILFSQKGYEGMRVIGKVNLPDYGMLKKLDVTLSIDTFDEVYGLDGKVDVTVIKAQIEFEIMREKKNDTWYLNKLVLAGGGRPGIPIIPPALFLTMLGGGVDNLAQLTNPYYGGADVFTVIVLTDLEVVEVFEGSFRGEFNKRKMRIEGELDIAGLEIIDSAYFEAAWDTGTDESFYVEGGISVNILDIVVGTGKIHLSDKYFEASARVDVQVPKVIPIIGGTVLARAEAGIGTIKLWASLQVNLLVKIKVGVTYYWDDGIDFDVGSRTMAIPQGMSGMYSMPVTDAKGRHGRATYGTNMRIVGDTAQPVGSGKVAADGDAAWRDYAAMPKLLAAEAKTLHTLTMNDQHDYLFEIPFQGSTKPVVSIKDMHGVELELIEGDNYYIRTGEGNRKYMVVGFSRPETGDWTAQFAAPTETKLAEVTPVPELTELQAEMIPDTDNDPAVDSRKLDIHWDGDHYTAASKLNLYLSHDRETAGYPIAHNLSPASGSVQLAVPDGVQTGDYYVYASLSTEPLSFSSLYAPQPVHIVNPKAPPGVGGVQGAANGNGMLKATWETNGDPNTTGYDIEVRDTDPQAANHFGIGHVDAVAGASVQDAVIGGTYKASSGELLGLKTGRTYQIGVTPVREDENGHSYYGPTTFSSAVALPVPNPPTVHAAIDPKHHPQTFVNAEGAGTLDTSVKDRDVTLDVSVNQAVTAAVYVDFAHYDDFNIDAVGQAVDIPLYQLTDGDHMVDIVAKNAAGDITVQRVKFKVDTKAPVLLLDDIEPNAGSAGGDVVVAGTTEAGVALTIGNQAVTVDEHGHFSQAVAMPNTVKLTLPIVATDIAGNTTAAEIQVARDGLHPLARVQLEAPKLEFEVGKPQQLQLVGIQQESGDEVIVNPELVHWSLLEGDGIASIDEAGRLTAQADGDIAVLASYRVTDDYAYEDAVALEAYTPVDTTETQEPPPQYDPEGEPGPLKPPPGQKLPIGPATNPMSELERKIEQILQRIIAQNVEKLKLFDLTPDGELLAAEVEEIIVTVAAGTVSDDDKLFIGRILKPDTYLQESGNVQAKTIVSSIYELEVLLDQLGIQKPIEISFRYKPEKVNDPGKLSVYRYNDYLHRWEYLLGVVDTDKLTVTVKVAHFSKYALFERGDTSTFADLPHGQWSEAIVYGLESLGLVDGIQYNGEKRFEPWRSITRAEFIKLLTVAKQYEIGNTLELREFADWYELADWSKPYVYAGIVHNLLQGRETARGLEIAADAPITRAEAATLIGRAMPKTTDEGKAPVTFADAADIPAFAKSYINRMAKEGIVNGYDDQTFKPQNLITREEAAAMIYRLVDYFGRQ